MDAEEKKTAMTPRYIWYEIGRLADILLFAFAAHTFAFGHDLNDLIEFERKKPMDLELCLV